MARPFSRGLMGSGPTGSTPGGGSGSFSTTTTEVPDRTEASGTFLSGLEGVIEAGTKFARATMPVWTENERESQSTDQLRDPTFDQRTARDRVGNVETTQGTTRVPNMQGQLVPGVNNMALLFFGVALVGTIVVARNL